MSDSPALCTDEEGLILRVLVQPRASRDEIVGPQDDAIKVRITAPPLDNQANQHLCRYLAKQFGVALRDVEILSGQQGRRKRLRIRHPSQWPAVLKM